MTNVGEGTFSFTSDIPGGASFDLTTEHHVGFVHHLAVLSAGYGAGEVRASTTTAITTSTVVVRPRFAG